MTAFAFPEQVLAGHTAVLGMTGSGKTSTEKLLIEQVVAAGRRVCILDTMKSDHWGLTSSASGKRPGLPFTILGGPRGHVPLPSTAGKAIGELVGRGKLPLSIVDMSDFEAGGIQRFFVAFAESLWRHAKGVVYLVIEEAHEIAPKERAGFGAENMAIHWAKKLATGSRTKGIRLVVATQRTQALHNAVLGSMATVIAHRMTFDADQEPVLRWLKAADKEMASQVGATLASLPDGTGWLCNGVARLFERTAFPKFKTYDNTKTPDADSPEAQVTTAPVDQDGLRAIIGDAVAAAEADDPKKLRGEIAKRDVEIAALKRQAVVTPQIDPTALAAAEQRGAVAARSKVLGLVESLLRPLAGLAGQVHGDLESAVKSVQEAGLATPAPPTPPPARAFVSTPAGHRPPSAPVVRTTAVQNGDDRALGAERKPLAVLAGAYPAGMTEGQWALASKLKRTGGTWSTYLSRLRMAGRIEERGNLFYATQKGVDDIGAQVLPLPAPGPELVDYWALKLRGKPADMLRTLAGAFPRWVERGDLAAAVELTETGGTFGTYLSRVRAPGLMEESGTQVRLAPSLLEAA